MTQEYSAALSDLDIEYAKNLFTSLKSCWITMHSERGDIPLRKQFNPGKVRELIPHLYMLEWTDGDQVKVRHRSSGLEQATLHRFLVGDHLRNYTEKDWAIMGLYFDAIFAGPCGAESDWRYFTKEGEVYDTITYSLPLYGRDESQRLAVGVMLIRQNFDPSLVEQCDGADRSQILHARYLDVGFGVADDAPNFFGR